ncbi:MAG: hypothetical protein ACR2HS_01535 [Gammaproteobacteria bacterium]
MLTHISSSGSNFKSLASSASNSSIVGNVILRSSGKFSVNLYYARPIGLAISRNVYSARTPTFDLHKINPWIGYHQVVLIKYLDPQPGSLPLS